VFGRAVGPATALALLSPFMAEVLSGASPVVLLLIPPFAVLDLCLYGCGALLIRELVVRWGRGWPSILALGVAFAMVEEGLVVASFTDPLAPPRRDLGGWGAGPDGTNWVWIPLLCVFHAVVSIALPILLVHLANPGRAGQRWLTDRRLAVVAALFLFGVALGRAVFSSGVFGEGYYARIEGWQLAASLAAIAALSGLARLLPRQVLAARPGLPPAPGLIAVLSAAVFMVFFVAGWGGRELGLAPAVALGIALGVVAISTAGLILVSSRAGWSDRHRFAIPTGVAGFYVALSPALGPLNLLVGVGAGYGLWRGWRSLARRMPSTPEGVEVA
jgi:hypothetical protein